MKDKSVINDICENIEKEFRLLAELTGVDYITATFINDHFMMWSTEDKTGNKPIDIYKGEEEE